MRNKKYSILIVDDDKEVTFVLEEELKAVRDYLVRTVSSGNEAFSLVQSTQFDVILLDIRMPRVSGFEVLDFIKEHSPDTPVIMFTQLGDVPTAIKAIKQGAYDYVTKPYDPDELQTTIRRAVEHRKLLIEKEAMRIELSRAGVSIEPIGESLRMKETLEMARKVAASKAFVLIEGASGTGKELIAHLLHNESPRRDSPFVAVNCASIPDALLESELFGHEKGSFTSAHVRKQGLVEVANGGTLFLDEVGDISPAIQPKLLRFLETGEFRRVGGTLVLTADVRVVSATNKDLKEEVTEGRFREDLLYRLNVVTIKLPLLSERKEDIPLLANHFISLKSKTKKLSDEALQLLLDYSWPGNIRELEHLIEGALVLSQGDTIEPKDFAINLAITGQVPPIPQIVPETSKQKKTTVSISQLEKDHIEEVLKQNNYNRAKSAKILGISQKTLYLKIKKYRIVTPENR